MSHRALTSRCLAWTHGLAGTAGSWPWHRGRHGAEGGSWQTLLCFFLQCCEAIYSSVSGLKAHLANCNKVGPSAHSLGGVGVRGLVPSGSFGSRRPRAQVKGLWSLGGLGEQCHCPSSCHRCAWCCIIPTSCSASAPSSWAGSNPQLGADEGREAGAEK